MVFGHYRHAIPRVNRVINNFYRNRRLCSTNIPSDLIRNNLRALIDGGTKDILQRELLSIGIDRDLDITSTSKITNALHISGAIDSTLACDIYTTLGEKSYIFLLEEFLRTNNYTSTLDIFQAIKGNKFELSPRHTEPLLLMFSKKGNVDAILDLVEYIENSQQNLSETSLLLSIIPLVMSCHLDVVARHIRAHLKHQPSTSFVTHLIVAVILGRQRRLVNSDMPLTEIEMKAIVDIYKVILNYFDTTVGADAARVMAKEALECVMEVLAVSKKTHHPLSFHSFPYIIGPRIVPSEVDPSFVEISDVTSALHTSQRALLFHISLFDQEFKRQLRGIEENIMHTEQPFEELFGVSAEVRRVGRKNHLVYRSTMAAIHNVYDYLQNGGGYVAHALVRNSLLGLRAENHDVDYDEEDDFDDEDEDDDDDDDDDDDEEEGLLEYEEDEYGEDEEEGQESPGVAKDVDIELRMIEFDEEGYELPQDEGLGHFHQRVLHLGEARLPSAFVFNDITDELDYELVYRGEPRDVVDGEGYFNEWDDMVYDDESSFSKSDDHDDGLSGGGTSIPLVVDHLDDPDKD